MIHDPCILGLEFRVEAAAVDVFHDAQHCSLRDVIKVQDGGVGVLGNDVLSQDLEEIGTPFSHNDLMSVHILLCTDQEHIMEHGVAHKPAQR